LVTLAKGQIIVERAPPRRRRTLTTAGRHKAKATKTR
jgi:hypothetical protein